MNYILDCGFSSGVFSRRFLRQQLRAGNPLSNWTVFGFEPDNRWYDKWDDLKELFPAATFHIYKAAVWTEDGEQTFYPCKHAVSSYLQGAVHRKFESGRKISKVVPAVDLDRVIRELIDAEQIVLKVDIEGGEFYVLPHIQASGAADLLSHAFIEYHARLNRKDWLPIMIQIKEWWAAHPEIQTRKWR